MLSDGQFHEAYGYRVPNEYGLDLFAHKECGRWRVTEGRSGLMLCGGITNKKNIVKQVSDLLDSSKRDAVENAVAASVEKRGLSPLYRESGKSNGKG